MKNIRRSRTGLTILEILVVILIIFVLSGLAFPIYRRTIDVFYGEEAIKNMRVIKAAMDTCAALNDISETISGYEGCSLDETAAGTTISISNPNDDPKAKFIYEADQTGGNSDCFKIEAFDRLAGDAKDLANTITIHNCESGPGPVVIYATGKYVSLSTGGPAP